MSEDSNDSDEVSSKSFAKDQDVQPPPQKKAKNKSGKVKTICFSHCHHLSSRYHLFYLQHKKISKAIVPIDSSSDSEPDEILQHKVNIGAH